MSNEQEIKNNPWGYIYRFMGRRLLFINIGANLTGASIVTFYFVFIDQKLPVQRITNTVTVGLIMFIGLVIIGIVFHHNWGKDLDRFIRLKTQNRDVAPELNQKAQRKILNLPYIASLICLFNWLLAAFIMSTNTFFASAFEGTAVEIFFEIFRGFTGIIIAGVVTSVIIFFTVETFCRRTYPYFFPLGGIVKISGVFRLKLHNRMLITFALVIILPMVLMSVLSYNKARLMLEMNPEEVIDSLFYLTAFLLTVALTIAIIFSRLFSNSILNPVKQMEHAMGGVEKGNLSVSVPVSGNDELGVLAENFNKMIEGLKERYHMRQSLDLAMEVQQNLLPKGNLKSKGFDIAGKSIYCDETGGDYYDFIISGRSESEQIGVAIGDVSGHGIASALLMATVRSSLRQRSSLPGNAGVIISDVNRQLVRDVEDSGQFMTMFYLSIDPMERHLHWVRAGHDPAIFYDPGPDSFEELGGPGIALGVDENWVFEDNLKTDLTEGQIILLSTDGIWEARNRKGEMFGKERICDTIRKNSSLNGNEILDLILKSLSSFQKGTKIEDDITLVVIKINS